MAHVTGIGGFFFRADDPDGLAAWYREHLELDIGGAAVWGQRGGPTILAPMAATTDYFPAAKQWMLNLRVDDLDGLMTALRAAGVAIETRPEWDTEETGRFGRIHDPEGNPIELWEPPVEMRGEDWNVPGT